MSEFNIIVIYWKKEKYYLTKILRTLQIYFLKENNSFFHYNTVNILKIRAPQSISTEGNLHQQGQV